MGENFREFRGSVPVRVNIIHKYCMRAVPTGACSDSVGVADIIGIRENFICKIHKCQPAGACSDSVGVADIMGIRENFVRKIHKCQPFAKIFSQEINVLYGSTCGK